MFGKLKSVDWISKITLSKNREEQISSCFEETKVNFSYPSEMSEIKTPIKIFIETIKLTKKKQIIMMKM